jgi:ribonucleoside-diphosphate reductase subunit M1
MWIPDLFMKRLLESGSMWSLMDPDECPGLNDVYGDEYETLYLKYESEKKYRKRVATVDVWNAILT